MDVSIQLQGVLDWLADGGVIVCLFEISAIPWPARDDVDQSSDVEGEQNSL